MRNKKSLLSALLAAVLLFACVAGMLIVGVSAEEPTHKVLEVDGVGASGSGKYKTVTAALQSVNTSAWAPGSTLTIEISAEATSGESLNKVGETSSLFLVFSETTNFLSDGTKVPITIRSTYIPDGEEEARSALRFLNWGYSSYNYIFANDYTFENIDLYLSKSYQSKWNSDGSRKITSAADYLFAGCGEVVFKNVRFCRSNYQYIAADKSDTSTKQEWISYTVDSRNTTFYGDLYASALNDSKGTDYLNGIFHNWDADKFAANVGEDGLLKTGFTFDNTDYFTAGSNVGSPSPQAWQRAYVAASYGGAYEYAGDDFSVSNEDIHAYITVTGDSVMTRLNGFRSNNIISAPAKASLNVNGNATVYGIFADSGNGGSYHDGDFNAYIANPRKVNVEINVSGNATVKGNNGSSADSCSISGVTDATYTEDSKIVINISGGTIEQEVIAVGGHNTSTGKSGGKFYNLPLDTAGEFEINIRGGEFADSIYGIYSKNIYNCHTLRGTVDINLYTPVAKAVYGVYSDVTDKPNYTGTIDPSEKGVGSVIAEGAKVTVSALEGTHTNKIYGIAGGGGAVRADGEISVVLDGATIQGTSTLRLGEGVNYVIESGAKASCYLTKGNYPADAVFVTAGSKTTEADAFAEGSTLAIEVGDITFTHVSGNVYFPIIKEAYIKGDVEIVYNGTITYPAFTSSSVARPVYNATIGGDFTLKITPAAGEKFVAECDYQSVYGSYITGDTSVLVDGGAEKNVHFKKLFHGATGYNTVQTLKNAKFDSGIYSDRSGSSGRSYRATAAEGANNVTWYLDNITAKYFYPCQYDTAGGGMKIYGKLTNNIESSKITSTVYLGSYRSYYKDTKSGSVTQTTPYINEIENNFKGGNTFSGTVYCGGRTASKPEPEYGSVNSIVNNITGTNSFNIFYAGANGSESYHSESIGSITTTIAEGSTFNTFYAGSKYAWYQEGVQGTITTTINGGVFKSAVYAGNPEGAAAAAQTLTINGGTFCRVYGEGVAMADNADVIILPQVSLILKERVEMKVLLDKRLVDLYREHVGTPALTFKFDGKDLGKGNEDLTADGDVYVLMLPAASAQDFDLSLEYIFDGNQAATTTIQALAEEGAKLYADVPAGAIFKALVDYGKAANDETELKYFDASKLDSSLLPTPAAPVAGAGTVKINSVTLLMGDAIGIRFKSDSDVSRAFVTVDGNILSSSYYKAANGCIDIYVNAENLNQILNIEIYDQYGVRAATFGYAVSNIAADIYQKDTTNLKAAAVLELILAIEASKTVA